MRQRITVIRGDFLIPGTGVGLQYENTPFLRVSLIRSFVPFTTNGSITHGISFNTDVKWYYNSKSERDVELNRITKLLIPEEDEHSKGVFE